MFVCGPLDCSPSLTFPSLKIVQMCDLLESAVPKVDFIVIPRLNPVHLRPRSPPVTECAWCRRFYGKIEDCETVLRFNFNVCDNYKLLKRNLNFNFYQLETYESSVTDRSTTKEGTLVCWNCLYNAKTNTCLYNSYLVIESSRKHYVIL